MRLIRPAAPDVPVIPGREPAPGTCEACGSSHELAARTVIDGFDMTLCLDVGACAQRYRRGASPESYALALRGELLAVAP